MNPLLTAIGCVDLPTDHSVGFQAAEGTGNGSFVFDRGNGEVLLPKPVFLYEIRQKSHLGTLRVEALKLHLLKEEAGKLATNAVGQEDEVLLW